MFVLSACPGRFTCSNNLCINNTLRCDGWGDCGDDSDEINCSESKPSNFFLSEKNEIKGAHRKWSFTFSVPNNVGFSLCASLECDASQIQCKNGHCKPKFWLCDGVDDCGDNTDEENCGECSETINWSYFSS